jgi:hypothetical protein
MKARRGGLALFGMLILLRGSASAAPPDFTGAWRLDPQRSDDLKARIEEAAGSAYVKGGGTSPLTILPMPGTRKTVERVELRDWLLTVASQVDRLEVEQSTDSIKLFHGEDIARTFYFGRKHMREDDQGNKLECNIHWKGEQLVFDEQGDNGHRVMEMLTLVPTSDLLIQNYRLEDRLLKKPLELRLVYVRSGAAAAPR